MNANEVIESYVRDVARFLPHRKRNDVAFELRALLTDELAARAHLQGRAPDRAMAMDLLKGFGRPAEAAGRYHQRPAIIDPADTHHFIIWTLAGAVTIGALSAMSPAGQVDGDPFLKWLGVLVIVFALMGWWRRQRPTGAMGWKPKRVRDPYHANRFLSITLGLLTLIPLFMYAGPRTFAEVFFLSAIPTSGLVLDAAFLHSPIRGATLMALGLHTMMYFWVATEGRWRRLTCSISFMVFLAMGLLLGSHAGLAARGLVFVLPHANEVAAPIFALVGAFMVLCAFYEAYQQWAHIDPAPTLAGGTAGRRG